MHLNQPNHALDLLLDKSSLSITCYMSFCAQLTYTASSSFIIFWFLFLGRHCVDVLWQWWNQSSNPNCILVPSSSFSSSFIHVLNLFSRKTSWIYAIIPTLNKDETNRLVLPAPLTFYRTYTCTLFDESELKIRFDL